MADSRRSALLSGVFSTATSAAFFVSGVVGLPLPLYLPLTRRWIWGTAAPELSMDYFGRSLFALTVGAFATLVAWGLLHLFRRWTPTARVLRLGLAYAITALLLCASLFAYKLYGREPIPIELPGESGSDPGPMKSQ